MNTPTLAELILGFRFGVLFIDTKRGANPLDIRFQKVSGLSAEVTTAPQPEGGQNLYTQKLPERVSYGNLVLTRGFVVGSPLNIEFNATMSLFKFAPSNVLVTLFNEIHVPVAAWMFLKTFPIKWSTSDLDAEEPALLIDTLELAYTRMQAMRL